MWYARPLRKKRKRYFYFELKCFCLIDLLKFGLLRNIHFDQKRLGSKRMDEGLFGDQVETKLEIGYIQVLVYINSHTWNWGKFRSTLGGRQTCSLNGSAMWGDHWPVGRKLGQGLIVCLQLHTMIYNKIRWISHHISTVIC